MRAAVGPDITLITPGVRPAGADSQDQARVATPSRRSPTAPTCWSSAGRSPALLTRCGGCPHRDVAATSLADAPRPALTRMPRCGHPALPTVAASLGSAAQLLSAGNRVALPTDRPRPT